MDKNVLLRGIRTMWSPSPSPWNAVQAATHMLDNGVIPVPGDLTPDQMEIFLHTHTLMCQAAQEVHKAVAHADLDPEIWKVLLRGGVGERLYTAPGETSAIKIINAMRGERKAWPMRRVERLWEQLSYPAGLADAALTLMGRYSHPDLEPYRAVLLSVVPALRRCKKKSQERRTTR